MKKIFRDLLFKFEKFKYVIILLLALSIIYLGIPGASSGLALGAGLAGCDPVLIGASISIGGGIGSTLSQYTGQAIFNDRKPSKIIIKLEKIGKEKEYLVIPILIFASISLVPETYLFATVGKDIPKIKMLIINLISRFFNFWLTSWLGKNYLKKIFQSLIKKIKKK